MYALGSPRSDRSPASPRSGNAATSAQCKAVALASAPPDAKAPKVDSGAQPKRAPRARSKLSSTDTGQGACPRVASCGLKAEASTSPKTASGAGAGLNKPK